MKTTDDRLERLIRDTLNAASSHLSAPPMPTRALAQPSRPRRRLRQVAAPATAAIVIALAATVLAVIDRQHPTTQLTGPVASPHPTATAHPTASPRPFATVYDVGGSLSPVEIALASRLYTAAVHHDAATLDHLLCACVTGTERAAAIAQFGRPAIMDQMARVLKTHPDPTDGLTYPGFIMAGWSSWLDLQDGRFLGLQVPRRPRQPGFWPVTYTGLILNIGESADAPASSPPGPQFVGVHFGVAPSSGTPTPGT